MREQGTPGRTARHPSSAPSRPNEAVRSVERVRACRKPAAAMRVAHWGSQRHRFASDNVLYSYPFRAWPRTSARAPRDNDRSQRERVRACRGRRSCALRDRAASVIGSRDTTASIGILFAHGPGRAREPIKTVIGANLNQLKLLRGVFEARQTLERAARGRARWRLCACATARPEGCPELRRKIQGRARSGRRTGPARAEIWENAHTLRANDRRSEPIESQSYCHTSRRSPQVRCATRPRVELAEGIHRDENFLRAAADESEQFCLV